MGCDASGPCQQFGDLTYLVNSEYDRRVRNVVQTAERVSPLDLLKPTSAKLVARGFECRAQGYSFGAVKEVEVCARLVASWFGCGKHFMLTPQQPAWGCRCCKPGHGLGGPTHSSWNLYEAVVNRSRPELDRNKLYVVPYERRQWKHYIAEAVGHIPPGLQNVIPPDIRTDHFGTLFAKHRLSRAPLLLVDRASSRQFLPPELQLIPRSDILVVAGPQGQTCDNVCAERKMQCDRDQLQFVNSCEHLRAHFKCKFCSHQVGAELPCYSAADRLTRGQCLVTFVSDLACETKHPNTARLCTCKPRN